MNAVKVVTTDDGRWQLEFVQGDRATRTPVFYDGYMVATRRALQMCARLADQGRSFTLQPS